MLKIQTTGIEQYASGGEGRLQVMIIAGPGAGKTRFSSYWPKPIYANCEAGLASIADRKMPFVDIKKSQDMLDLLTYLKTECRRPYKDRQFQTVVIDTLDAFQRAVKDEWLQANPGAQSFRGFDAWGYLDAKMQMLLTRLLNLDMNVVVLAHYKDKTIKEGVGENATERQELMLQLSGDVKDSVFNDFDLVGWMDTYWEVEDGERVEKRGLTFTKTPKLPFLKDRLHVTPKWMEVQFAPSDYDRLFEAFSSRLNDLSPGEEVGEIAPAGPEESRPTSGVVSPSSGGGPLPAQDPRDIPLQQFDKPTLQTMARELGCEFRQNHIKAELIDMIEKARAAKVAKESDASSESPPAEVAEPPAEAAPAAEPDAATPVQGRDEDEIDPDNVPMALVDLPGQSPATPVADEPVTDIATEVGLVNSATGEIVEMSVDEVADALGGEVISEPDTVDASEVPASPAPSASPSAPPAPAAAPPAAAPAGRAVTCEEPGCDTPLAGENQDYVKLSQIKFRAYLCNAHYIGRKKAS